MRDAHWEPIPFNDAIEPGLYWLRCPCKGARGGYTLPEIVRVDHDTGAHDERVRVVYAYLPEAMETRVTWYDVAELPAGAECRVICLDNEQEE